MFAKIVFRLICCVAFTASAVAQLEGRFYLAKNQFVAGEPVYVYFEVTNNSKEPVEILAANKYTFCAGYQFRISDGSSLPIHANPSCGSAGWGGGGSCASSDSTLRPGGTRTDDILLNYQFDLSLPGVYHLTAIRELPYGTADEGYRGTGPKLRVSAQLEIIVGAADEAHLRSIWQPYLTDLLSKDLDKHSEAAMIISRVAPMFLEDVIFDMLTSPSDRGYALVALERLNTPRARKYLAELAVKGDTSDCSLAVRYLGEKDDRSYFPLMHEIASTSRDEGLKQAATIAAARLGRDESIPMLVSLLRGHTQMHRIYAMQGLYAAASRGVVPVLIGLLRDPDDFIARGAADTLVDLTHRTPITLEGQASPYQFERNPASQYPLWVHWWALHGSTAPIYEPNDCGEVEALN